jgi:hypothetical protein
MSYKLIEWEPSINLNEFYNEAQKRGFINNSSQKKMIDCLRNERSWNAWILFNNNKPIGSVAAHSFDLMGEKSFRILTRVCTFGEERISKGLITTKKLIEQHQNLTDQFLLPKCIQWAGFENKLFATSNESKEASQRLVHKYYFPTLAKLGIVSKTTEVFYRGINQTVWQVHPEKFFENLKKYPRWT